MSDKKLSDGFIAYIDDNEKIIKGMCQIKEITESNVSFYTNDNLIIIPMHRVLKIKIRKKEEDKTSWEGNQY